MKLILSMCLFALMSLQCHAQKGTRCETCITHPDSCVIYTAKQDERCILTFIKSQRQDSLIIVQKNQLHRADSIIFDQQLKINDYEPELKRRRKNVYKAGFCGTIGGFLMGIAAFGIALLN